MPQKFTMITEAYLCFYITNVCNLTCDTCITYNDLRFKEHFKFEDYKDKCQRWGEILLPPKICILGGEPYANPDLLNWVVGLRSCWPNLIDFCVSTNGTYLHQLETSRAIIDQKLWIDVSLHDPSHYNLAKSRIEETLSIYNYTNDITIGTNMTDATYEEENYYIDGRLAVKLSKVYEFGTNSTKMIHNSVIYMHTSDPIVAHENCKARLCHYVVKGDLYKCFLTGIHQELTNQFTVDLESKKLLDESNLCNPFDPIEKIEKFIGKLEDHVPQCRLCPEKRLNKPLWPLKPVKEKI
jgi:organic radical activating enzyme